MDITSFEIIDPSIEANSIWSNLWDAIAELVQKDGINKDVILESELESDVSQNAIDTIYDDVSEFYSWYFEPDDNRNMFLKTQKRATILTSIKVAVKAVVIDNLDAMREVDEIPEGEDVEGLSGVVTDNLSRYVLNWQDWYYDRKREMDIDNYFEQKSLYEDSYLDNDYGDLESILDDGQYDGLSDIPYLSKELGLDSEE